VKNIMRSPHKWFLGAVTATMAILATGQTTTGVITGTVIDPSGNVIPAANVSIINEATGDARRTDTTSRGDFIFPSLLPATYTVQVEMTGFQIYKSNGNVLTPNGRLALGELRLTIGSVTETVEVAAQTAQVATQSSENSGLLTRDQFSMVPTKGRDLTNMLRLLPGVQMTGDQDALGGATGFGATMGAVSGTRSADQNLTVDGIVANDLGAPAGLSGQLNMDAVQEVKVLLSNYQAEYGRNPGANISMTTRAGTREFHGSAYYYVRNDFFNANDFFRNKSPSPGLNSKPAIYRFHTFGATLGGPVPFAVPKLNPHKEKLFFFYSYDDTRDRIPDAGGGLGVSAPSITRYTQPTALERSGNFSQSAVKPIDPANGSPFPNNQIPQNRINPAMAAMINLYPLPNVPDNGAWNYETLRILRIPNFQHVFRIDDKLTPKDTLYVRGAIWHKDTFGPGGTVGYGSNMNWDSGIDYHYQYWDDSLALNYTRTWSARIISEFTAGVRHSTEREDKDNFSLLSQKYTRTALGLNKLGLGYLFSPSKDNIFDLIPNVTYTNTQINPTTIGFGTRFGLPGADFQFNITHATTFVFNNHTVKVGLYWDRARDIEGRVGIVNGQFDFGLAPNNPLNSGNIFANQLLGNFYNYQEANTRNTYLMFRWNMDVYAQDTWKLTRKLTLDYGIRFSEAPWFHQNDGKAAIFDPARYVPGNAPRQYTPAIINGVRAGYDAVTGQVVSAGFISAYVPGTGNITNGMVTQNDPGVPLGFISSPGLLVMPRFGFAYDPFGDGKMAIRAGGGVFYQTEDDGFFTGAAQVPNPPFVYTAQAFDSNISQLTPGSGYLFPPVSLFGGVTGYDLKTGRPLTYNYSFGVQRDLGKGAILDVKYVGSLGRHLGGRRDMNTIPFGSHFANIDPTIPGGTTPLLDNLQRPYPGYGSITIIERNLSSHYNSLQATLNRRFTRGLEFGVAYTYSKSMDYGSDERSFFTAATPNYLPLSRNYGLSSFDQTQVLTVNWQYDVPGAKSSSRTLAAVTKNWQISGVAAFATGTPFGITPIMLGDLLGGGDIQRVNLTCKPNLGHYDKTPDKFFDTSCIQFPGNTLGNANKAVVRGPGRSNLDLSLFRNFNLGSDKRVLTFRAEAYNAFNHTQLNAIDTTAVYLPNGINLNPTFGQALGAWPARQMQFSLRLRF
jgi:hypothetical protein